MFIRDAAETHISKTTWRPCAFCQSNGSQHGVGSQSGEAYIDAELLLVRVLDGWVIALDPLIVDELCCRQTDSQPNDSVP